MENERFLWVDYAKAIGIFLVVLAHTPLWTPAQNFIYVFHMPLFFFISGYLFSHRKHVTYLAFIKRRTKQLLVPYLFFSAITFLFWLFVGRKFGDDAGASVLWYKPLLGILYGIGRPPWLVHCIPLWFILCLFVVENIYYLIFKNTDKKFLLLVLFGALGYIDYQYNPVRMFWSVNTALVALVFYAAGNIYKEKVKEFSAFKSAPLAGCLVVGALLVYAFSLINGRVNMHVHYYNNYAYFMIGGFIGIGMCIAVSVLLGRLRIADGVAEFISRNTIIILGFHLMAISLVKGVVYFVLKTPLESLNEMFAANLLLSFVSFLLLYPVIFVLNKWFPALVGKRATQPVSAKPLGQVPI
ncbi:acyltransferase family protein [Rufibacter roseus]|uniref:Acyltransferase family protein n=1 Tax=Rufibacter roseus TaxID=1567108 RepID=A0ABW2DQ26_9BACT|nr:acyltransferase family protein [Rufibacter roseus]